MTMPATAPTPGELMESVVIKGDLDQLTPEQRVDYYNEVCRTLGVNPLTRPFEYIRLQGKLQLYAKKDATDQLRKLNRVSVLDLVPDEREGVYVITARVEDVTGRKDAATGAVFIAGLRGEALANALMKAETKAKRRATLSICGLGFLDEVELEDVPRTPPRARPNVMLDTDSYPPQPPHVPPSAADAAPAEEARVTGQPAGAAPEEEDAVAADLALTNAAQSGMKALETAWRKLSPNLQAQLRAPLERRHKPKARSIDAMSRMSKEDQP